MSTRLPDWTCSSLVAAFFSVHPDDARRGTGEDRNTTIWALDAGELNQLQGFEPLTAPAFKNRVELDIVGVAMALAHDPRIQLRQGAFTIHASRKPIDLLEGTNTWLYKFIIMNEDIRYFFEELTLLGIKKYTLFPDLSARTSELTAMHLPMDV